MEHVYLLINGELITIDTGNSDEAPRIYCKHVNGEYLSVDAYDSIFAIVNYYLGEL